MKQMPKFRYWELETQVRMLEWIGDDGQNIADAIAERRDDLPAFQRELLAENTAFAQQNPLMITEDLDHNKNVMMIFFCGSIRMAMELNEVDFETASESIFRHFAGLEDEQKFQVYANAYDLYSSLISNANLSSSPPPPPPPQ